MRTRKPARPAKPTLATEVLHFYVWRDAAREWDRLRSDAAEARCRVARRDYYIATYGSELPTLKTSPRQGRKTPDKEKVSA